jgi:hypothetical protein
MQELLAENTIFPQMEYTAGSPKTSSYAVQFPTPKHSWKPTHTINPKDQQNYQNQAGFSEQSSDWRTHLCTHHHKTGYILLYN